MAGEPGRRLRGCAGVDGSRPPASEFRNDHLYVSVITLTTVGFGDVVAAGQAARTLLMLEALVGQIFLVTLVARLVALFGTLRPGVAPAGTPGPPGGSSPNPD